MNDRDIKLLNARSDAVAFISSGRRSSGKVRNKLLSKGYSHEIVSQVIEELISERRIDDEAYALSYIKSRTGSRVMSASALRSRLILSGVPYDTAVRMVEENAISSDNESDKALELLNLKFAAKAVRMLSGDTSEQRSSMALMYRFLTSRGFSADTATEAVRRFMDEAIR